MIATSLADLVGRASILHLFLHHRRIRKDEEEDLHSHFDICTWTWQVWVFAMTKVVHMLASKYNSCLHAICSRCIQLQLKSNSVACVPALNKYMKHKPHSHYLIIDSDFICEIIFPKAVQITITHSSNGGHLQRTFKAMSTKMQSAIIRRNSTCLFLF